jgi:MFS family permease
MTLWFPARQRGRVISLLFAASACAVIAGAPISGLVLGHLDGVLDLHGWNWLFLLGGLPSVALGLVVLRRLDDGVATARWLSPAEKRQVTGWITAQNREVGGHSLLAALRLPGFLLLGVIYFFIQIASYGLSFWAPHMIRSAGTSSPTIIGLLTAVPYVCGAITMLAVGRLSDASGERRTFVAALVLTAAVGFVAAGVFDTAPIMVVAALAITGAGVVAAIPTFWSLPPKLLTGAGAAGGIALINTLGQLGGIVSPVMVGHIKDATGSTTPALYVIAGATFVGAALILFGLPEALRRRDAAPTVAR